MTHCPSAEPPYTDAPMSAPVIARLALVALALVAGAWLAVSVRSSDEESEGAALVNGAGKLPEAEVARTLELLRDAKRFNADKDPEINEVILLSVNGRADSARVLAESVVAEEPENVDAWFALWAAAVAAGDREQAARGLREVRTLDPLRANVLEELSPLSSVGS